MLTASPPSLNHRHVRRWPMKKRRIDDRAMIVEGRGGCRVGDGNTGADTDRETDREEDRLSSPQEGIQN